MKMSIRNIMTIAFAMALLAAPFAQASTLYWDGGTADAGDPGNGLSAGGAGTWDTALKNWDAGAVPHVAWINGSLDTAYFGGTAGTVTLGEAISVGGLLFTTTGYTINNSTYTLTFGATDNTILLNNVGAATITGQLGGSGNVALTAANPVTAGTVTFNGISTGGWSGTTTVNPGIRLEMTGNVNNQALLNTSAIYLYGGTIAMGSATTVIGTRINRINDSAPINSYGGTIEWSVNQSGTTAETNGILNLISGQFNFVETYSLSSGNQIYTLSGLSRTGASNTSVASLQAKNTAFSTSGGQRMIVGGISANTPAGEIVGPWLTTLYSNLAAADYIIYSNGGSGGTYYAIPAAATLTAPGESGWSSSTTAYQFAAAATLSATRSAAALRYTGAAASLGLGASTFNLETYGILNAGSGLLTISTTGTGCLTTSNTGSGTTNNLFLTTAVNAITVSAPIKDNTSVVTLVKSGSSTLTLASMNNTYSGGTVINAGSLNLGSNSDANLGAASGGLTFNGSGTITYTDGLVLNVNRTITLNQGANIALNNAITVNGKLTGSGAFSVNTADAFIFSNSSNDFSGTIMSATANSTGYGLDMASIGDATGAGLINLNNGTFRWIKASGGTTTFANRQFALSGTTGPGTISARGASSDENLIINKDLLITGVGNKTLTLAGINTGNNTFAGNIADGPSSVISLTKADAGKWILSGTNTYSGATTVTAGKLVGVVGGSCSNSAVTVSAANVTLGVSVTDNTLQWACNSLTYSAASTLEFAFDAITPSTTVAPLQVNGNIVFAVASAVSCTGSSLPEGTYPLMTWTGAFSGVAPSSLTLSSGTGLLVLDPANKTLWLSISASGSSKQPLTWKGAGDKIWIANEAVYTKWQDATPVNTNYQETTLSGITVGDNVVFGTTGAGTVTLNTIVSPASMSVASTANYTFSGTGSIAGPGGLTKTSSGTLTLATTNGYSGGTSLGAGTLSIGINDALGTGPVVLSGGTIQSSDATARTLNNPVVLNGNTTVGGTGNLSFTSPGAGSVAAASTLTVNGSLNATFATALSGSGALTKAGTGTMTLTGTNTYSGATTISGGSLVVNGGQITNNAAVFITGASSMAITNNGKVFSGGAAHSIGSAAGSSSVQVMGGGAGTSLWSLGNQDLYFGVIGNKGANNNSLRIDGAGVAGSAVVTNINTLYIGRTTLNSSMVMTNGAQMFVNGQVRMGNPYYDMAAGNNSIVIVGGDADSIFYGNNQPVYLGYGERTGSSYNKLYVGNGGVLTNAGDVYVGDIRDSQNGDNPSHSNQLMVNDGGKAYLRSNIYVGYCQIASRRANSNSVLIANSGLVDVPSALIVGSPNLDGAVGSFNSTTITNGGRLFTGANSYIGRAEGNTRVANNNTAWVNGANSLWNLGNKNLFVGSATGTGQAMGNVFSVTAGGMATNMSALIVSAANTLSLGAGGQIYAGAATISGTLAVGLDKNATPVSGNLAVAGNLNVNSATLDVSLSGTPTTPCVIASYDSLTGSFAATNGLPATYKLEMDYKGQKQIAIVYSAAGTLIRIF